MPNWTATVRKGFALLWGDVWRAMLLLLALFEDALSSLGLQKKNRPRNTDQQCQSENGDQGTPPPTQVPHGGDYAPQTTIGHEGAQQQRNRKTHEAPLWYLLAQTFFGMALVFFGFGQVMVGNWQWDATDKQWQVMVLDQRPWLSFEPPAMEEPTIVKPLTGTVAVKNTGKTPAVLIGYAAIPSVLSNAGGFAIRHEEIRTDFPLLALDFNKTLEVLKGSVAQMEQTYMHNESLRPEYVITPGAFISINVTGPKDVTEQDLNLIEHEKGLVVIAVYVKYLDSSQAVHESWSCFVHDPRTKQCDVYYRYSHMD